MRRWWNGIVGALLLAAPVAAEELQRIDDAVLEPFVRELADRRREVLYGAIVFQTKRPGATAWDGLEHFLGTRGRQVTVRLHHLAKPSDDEVRKIRAFGRDYAGRVKEWLPEWRTGMKIGRYDDGVLFWFDFWLERGKDGSATVELIFRAQYHRYSLYGRVREAARKARDARFSVIGLPGAPPHPVKSIDGIYPPKLTPQQLMDKIYGNPGKTVTLVVDPNGGEPLTVHYKQPAFDAAARERDLKRGMNNEKRAYWVLFRAVRVAELGKLVRYWSGRAVRGFPQAWKAKPDAQGRRRIPANVICTGDVRWQYLADSDAGPAVRFCIARGRMAADGTFRTRVEQLLAKAVDGKRGPSRGRDGWSLKDGGRVELDLTTPRGEILPELWLVVRSQQIRKRAEPARPAVVKKPEPKPSSPLEQLLAQRLQLLEKKPSIRGVDYKRSSTKEYEEAEVHVRLPEGAERWWGDLLEGWKPEVDGTFRRFDGHVESIARVTGEAKISIVVRYRKDCLYALVDQAVKKLEPGRDEFWRSCFEMCGVPGSPPERVVKFNGYAPGGYTPDNLLSLVYHYQPHWDREYPLELEGGKKVVWRAVTLSAAARERELARGGTKNKSRAAATLLLISREDVERALEQVEDSARKGFPGLKAPPNVLGAGDVRWQYVLEEGDGTRVLRTCLVRGPPAMSKRFLETATRHFRPFLSPAQLFSPLQGTRSVLRKRLRQDDNALWFDVVTYARAPLQHQSGNTRSGFGVAYDQAASATYTGFFEGGRFHGPARVKYPRGGRFIGHFENGVRDGPAIVYLGPTTGARRALYEKGKLVESRRVLWESGYYDAPITTSHGKLLRGDPKDGRCTVEFPKLGRVTGHFVNGIAEGDVIAKNKRGEIMVFHCVRGIPALVRYIVCKHARRLVYDKVPDAFPYGDCLGGDSRGGTAILVMGGGRYYEGQVRNGQPHGKGELRGGKGPALRGNFVNGKREGDFMVIEGSLLKMATDGYRVLRFRDDKQIDSWVAKPLQQTPKKKPEYVRLPDMLVYCPTCGGSGVRMTKATTIERVTIFTGDPGNGAYTGWFHRGHRTTEVIPGRRVLCGDCGGSGTKVRKGGVVPRSWLEKR